MGHKHTIADKVKKLREHSLYWSLAFEHVVRNVSKVNYFIAKFFSGIDERGISVHYLPVSYFYGADFNYFAFFLVESRGLYVEYDILIVKRLTFWICYHFSQIVNEISLHAVYDFNIVCLGRVHSLRICLNDSMVGNGDGLVTPFCRSFNIFLHTCHGVHGAHSRMKMQLDSLFLACIHSSRRPVSLDDVS